MEPESLVYTRANRVVVEESLLGGLVEDVQPMGGEEESRLGGMVEEFLPWEMVEETLPM